ncbi:hypothetical protein C8R44DRAFT_989044 [Mycena epipterygia]|nr:hypothetical protein C8R44DRAFT_989044 [Mycena epipterygia]
MSSLAAFPEELLERILAAAVVGPSAPHPRAPWHPRPAAEDTKTPTRGSALLVSRAFYRIALPLFYHTVVLHNPSQARALLATLSADPLLARAVRSLILPAPSTECAAVLSLVAPQLRLLDVTLPAETEAGVALAAALQSLSPQQPESNLRTLAVRKAPGTYLSQPGPRAVLTALASVVLASPLLDETTTSFPLSADPALAPLVSALCTAPALHTLRTPLPALWAPPLLAISANPTVRCICLEGPAQGTSCPMPTSPAGQRHASFSESTASRPLLGTGLFLAAARSHTRLAELVRAGTVIVGWRGRAWTVGGGSGEGWEREGKGKEVDASSKERASTSREGSVGRPASTSTSTFASRPPAPPSHPPTHISAYQHTSTYQNQTDLTFHSFSHRQYTLYPHIDSTPAHTHTSPRPHTYISTLDSRRTRRPHIRSTPPRHPSPAILSRTAPPGLPEPREPNTSLPIPSYPIPPA